MCFRGDFSFMQLNDLVLGLTSGCVSSGMWSTRTADEEYSIWCLGDGVKSLSAHSRASRVGWKSWNRVLSTCGERYASRLLNGNRSFRRFFSGNTETPRTEASACSWREGTSRTQVCRCSRTRKPMLRQISGFTVALNTTRQMTFKPLCSLKPLTLACQMLLYLSSIYVLVHKCVQDKIMPVDIFSFQFLNMWRWRFGVSLK